MMADIERWKPVVGFEGLYEVSDLGRVRSLDRYVIQMCKWGFEVESLRKGRIISPGRTEAGYLQAHLYKDGIHYSFTIHALVLIHFKEPRPVGLEALHLDHSKENNKISNLKWGTRQENELAKLKAGRVPRGESSSTAKLTEQAVREIRASVGVPQETLALRYGCTFNNISAIQLRKSWRHV